MLSETEFKLLHLLPHNARDGGCDDLIKCETQVVSLEDNVSYETLSYVWEDQGSSATVLVNGTRVSITTSLEAALKRLRLSNRKRSLWIDQICINQQNVREMERQIPLMRQIYSNTAQGLIWLGEIDPRIGLPNAQAALEVVTYMSNYDQGASAHHPAPECLASAQTLQGPMQALESISKGRNPWWHRMWTLQEVVLPGESRVIWGPLSIRWATLVAAGQNFPVPPVDRIIGPYRHVVDALFTQTTGMEMTRDGEDSPLEILFRWNFRKASNPLDKVYGSLGLFPRGTLPRAEDCNYLLSAASLYAMATVDLIEHTRSLLPLALRCLRGLSENTPGIPGWAWDLGLSDQFSICTMSGGKDAAWHMMNTYDSYRACDGTVVDWARFSYDVHLNALSLTGFQVDTVSLICPRPDGVDGQAGVSRETSDAGMIDIINLWYATVKKHLLDQQQADGWADRFWMSLMGGLELDGEFFPDKSASLDNIRAVQSFIKTGERNKSCFGLLATMCHRTMFVTRRGLIGTAPPHSRVGDEVWILSGGNVPFILRPGDTPETTDHVFIGAAYVDGIMDGEAIASHDEASSVILI